MAKNSVRDFDATAANNTDIQSVDIAENCAPSGINNAIRELMADVKDVSTGTIALESPQADSLTVTGDLTVDTNTLYVDASRNNVGIGGQGASGRTVHVQGTGFTEVLVEKTDSTTSAMILGADSGAGSLVSRVSESDNTAVPMRFLTGSNERMRIDSSGNVGIGTSSPTGVPTTTLHINGTTNAGIHITDGASGATDSDGVYLSMDSPNLYIQNKEAGFTAFETNATERMRIDSSGNLLHGTTAINIYDNSGSGGGFVSAANWNAMNGVNDAALYLNRVSSDGVLVYFFQDGTIEGNITVTGSTVSYNGGHLSRWSQLTDGTKDTSIVKGTVMTNLDQMAVWSHDAIEAQDAVYDEDGNFVSDAIEAKDAFTEDNEQLNCMAVSSVEGDTNVAGVFVNWECDDQFNDMNIAMTGDMVIRIASGTTVARGDLLMSAGDGTAKPQDDDIVRSKTIAKVTSINVSHTYDDGSYLIPVVLMAC